MRTRLFVDCRTTASLSQIAIEVTLRHNSQNPLIDEIFILSAKGSELPLVANPHSDCKSIEIDSFVSLEWIVRKINSQIGSPSDITIIAKPSVCFDDVHALYRIELNPICVLALKNAPAKQDCQSFAHALFFYGPIKCLGIACSVPKNTDLIDELLLHLTSSEYFLCQPPPTVKLSVLEIPEDNRVKKFPIPLPLSDEVLPVLALDCERISTWTDRTGVIAFSLYRTGVIAFSLFGSKPQYSRGAIENTKIAKWLYPGWTVRIYLDSSVPSEIVAELKALNADIILMPDGEGVSGMFWRFRVADDGGFSRWIIRDADSRLNYRERRAVDEWIDSGRPYHVQRDHPAHHRPVMAGTFGGIRGALPYMQGMVDHWRASGRSCDRYSDDQAFLAEMVWPKIKQVALVHSSQVTSYTANVRPFPTEYENFSFVGERIGANEQCELRDRRQLIRSRLNRALSNTFRGTAAVPSDPRMPGNCSQPVALTNQPGDDPRAVRRASTLMPECQFFDGVFVINLDRRPDRWKSFLTRLPHDWPFQRPERISAVDGEVFDPPDWWTVGRGAWGCYRSHTQLLEKCLQEHRKSVLILEDDAVFCDDFGSKVVELLAHVPQDWAMLYLGGQHLKTELRPPRKVNARVYDGHNINRTHAYAVRGGAPMRSIYQHIHDWSTWERTHHLDHHLGRLHESRRHRIYAPESWLVGQAAGLSDIGGHVANEHFWPAAAEIHHRPQLPRTFVLVLGLHSSGSSAMAGVLYHLGIHLGNQLGGYYGSDPNASCGFEAVGLAKICEAAIPFPSRSICDSAGQLRSRLKQWIDGRRREARQRGTIAGGKYPTLCRLGEEVLDAIPHDLKVIHINRPLDESIRSLIRKCPQDDAAALAAHQKWLDAGKREFLARLSPDSILHVEYSALLAATSETIEQVIQFLDISPSMEQQLKALHFVDPALRNVTTEMCPAPESTAELVG